MSELTLRHPPRDPRGRVRPDTHLQWRSAIAAGAVAGVASLVLQSVLGSIVSDEGVWRPFHRIASLALGPGALADPDAFDGGIVATALTLYLALSSLYGLVFCGLVVEFSRESAPWLGAAAGIVLYLVNYYGFTGLYPWMVEMRGPVTLLSHAVFGGLLASCYWALRGDRPEARRLASG